jgi:hypothetical protein
MVRAVLLDAFNQFLVAEKADLATNGDGGLTADDLVFTFEDLQAEVELTATTNLALTGTITATVPFA